MVVYRVFKIEEIFLWDNGHISPPESDGVKGQKSSFQLLALLFIVIVIIIVISLLLLFQLI